MGKIRKGIIDGVSGKVGKINGRRLSGVSCIQYNPKKVKSNVSVNKYYFKGQYSLYNSCIQEGQTFTNISYTGPNVLFFRSRWHTKVKNLVIKCDINVRGRGIWFGLIDTSKLSIVLDTDLRFLITPAYIVGYLYNVRLATFLWSPNYKGIELYFENNIVYIYQVLNTSVVVYIGSYPLEFNSNYNLIFYGNFPLQSVGNLLTKSDSRYFPY